MARTPSRWQRERLRELWVRGQLRSALESAAQVLPRLHVHADSDLGAG